MDTPAAQDDSDRRLGDLLERTLAKLLPRRRFPESTYRLQFHAGFTFRQARELVPYLHDLGITDCYASPYLKARPGSLHGYDISDHSQLNPEIGTEEDYNAWVAALQERGLGQLLDVVPNHMGITGNANVWWNDVLENGPASLHAAYFDIDWASAKPDLHDKVLLPLLGDPYGKVLEAQQLSLSYEAGAFAIHYFEHRFPVSPCTYARILEHRLSELQEELGKEAEPFIDYQSILTAIAHLPPLTTRDPDKVAERHREKEVIKRRLAALTDSSPPIHAFIQHNVKLFSGSAGNPHSFDLLDDLLRHQAYRLSFWRVAADEINYRRFFDVNELAALSMERPEVFQAAHELIFRLLCEGKVTGLRIDHPDGLYDPLEYLDRLQEHFVLENARRELNAAPQGEGLDWQKIEGPLLQQIRAWLRDRQRCEALPLYVVVEKILGRAEPMPEDWRVCGTTGYEFLNTLNGLFVDPNNGAAFTRIYNRWTKTDSVYANIVYHKKFLILQVAMSSELHMLAHQLDRLSEKNRWSRDFTQNSLRHSLREIIASFPVYRSYIGNNGVPERDVIHVEIAVARAKQKSAALSASYFDFIRDMLLLKYPENASERDRAEQRRLVGKFQQVTAPVMAKGVEDTTFYVFNRLLSLNEVGGDPTQFGLLPSVFHQRNRDRQSHWPWGLSATSTHDTKRSEDIRARLNVLSEMPAEWQVCLTRWNALNRRHRIDLDYTVAPDRNDEYLIYQTLFGAWPLGELGGAAWAEFLRRIQAYLRKAFHEAKVHTSWVNPNPEYDGAVDQFVARILDAKENDRFLSDFRAFQKRISYFGLWNSLAQTLLKIASPGVPDLYQGTELWDFSLVDPDNRRPVDYPVRQWLLQEIKAQSAAPPGGLAAWARQLTEDRENGRIKLYLIHRALHCRRDNPGLFAQGEYLPVSSEGSKAEHVCAFLRQQQQRRALVAVPRLVMGLTGGNLVPALGADVWQDTRLLLPDSAASRRYRNIFTDEALTASDWNGRLALNAAEVFAHFPVALLLAQD